MNDQELERLCHGAEPRAQVRDLEPALVALYLSGLADEGDEFAGYLAETMGKEVSSFRYRQMIDAERILGVPTTAMRSALAMSGTADF